MALAANAVTAFHSNWYNMSSVYFNKLFQAPQRTAAISQVKPVERNFQNEVSTRLVKRSAQFAKEYQDHMLDLQKSAQKVYASKDAVSPSKMAAASSDKQVMDVASVSGEVSAPVTYQVNVEQVAAPQVNQSNMVRANSAPIGTGGFNLKTSEGSAQLHIDTAAVKTNRQLYNAIADEINRIDLGVTAQAQESNGMMKLSVTSNDTGVENRFSITGSLAEKMGLTRQKQSAQDAVYSVTDPNASTAQNQSVASNAQNQSAVSGAVNAQKQTSASNQISIGQEKVQVTLKKAGTARVEIQENIKENARETADRMSELVDNYNKTLQFLKENQDNGSGVLNQLRRMSRRIPEQEGTMKQVGITVDRENGTLSFNREAFAEAMESNPSRTREIISGRQGVAQNIEQTARIGYNTSSARLTDGTKAFQDNQRFMNQLMQSNVINQWAYSPMANNSKANSYNMYQYFTSGAMMSMYI